jgi:hypothetical protein
MEWQVTDRDGFVRRKYSNSSMRRLRVYIDTHQLKSRARDIVNVLDRIIEINGLELRTTAEITADRERNEESESWLT